jgi:hypothetical protein
MLPCLEGIHRITGGTLFLSANILIEQGLFPCKSASAQAAPAAAAAAAAAAMCAVGTKCMPCPEGTTTPAVGATSTNDCHLCAPGYGGPDKSSCRKCASGFFQPLDTSQQKLTGSLQCLPCPTNRAFSYAWTTDMPADVYYPPATSVIGASAAEMCLSEFAQTADGAFFLELRTSEEYAAVGSNTSVFTLRVRPQLGMCCWYRCTQLLWSPDSTICRNDVLHA